MNTVKVSRNEIIQSMFLFLPLLTIAQMLPSVKKTSPLPWVLNCIITWWQFLHYLLLFQCYLSILFIDAENPTLSCCWMVLGLICFLFSCFRNILLITLPEAFLGMFECEYIFAFAIWGIIAFFFLFWGIMSLNHYEKFSAIILKILPLCQSLTAYIFFLFTFPGFIMSTSFRSNILLHYFCLIMVIV